MRTVIRNSLAVLPVTILLISSSLTPLAAHEVDLDDPNIFGPGESWERPTKLIPWSSGPWVRRLQEELAEAGFRPGATDGIYGKETLGAVYAFQKLHELERDGVFRSEHWELLEKQPDLPMHIDSPDRVEVDLAKQVLYLVKEHQVEAVLPISSGNGGTYRNASGTSVRARTPEGDYQFYKQVEGWRISYLGGLYRPFYFRGGYAIHGSKSVPPYPASHGCVRVELHDMDYLTTELELGMPIFVYGQRTTRDDVIPPPPPPPEPVRELPVGLPIGLPWSPAIA